LVIPGIVVLWLFAQPFIAKSEKGHRLNLIVLWTLLGGMGLLTWLAIAEDRSKPMFQAAVSESEQRATRVKELAKLKGIPAEGAVTLLRKDPKTHGPRIFAAHCSSCHRYSGHDGRGNPVSEKQSAPDLAGFASREWVENLLDHDHFVSESYFGNTKFVGGKMAKKLAKFEDEDKVLVPKVAALLSDLAGLPYQGKLSENEREAGFDAFFDQLACIDCHDIEDEDEGSAPDLTGYGSREWLIAFLEDPAHERFYGSKNDRMPSFGRDKKIPPRDIELVVDWLRKDWDMP
jgi:ubiquinol-cytochrome c reductase cytochrome b subunit